MKFGPALWLCVFLAFLSGGLYLVLELERSSPSRGCETTPKELVRIAKEVETSPQSGTRKTRARKQADSLLSSAKALEQLLLIVREKKKIGLCLVPEVKEELRQLMNDYRRPIEIRQLATSVLLEDSTLHKDGLDEMRLTLYQQPSLVGESVLLSLQHLIAAAEIDQHLYPMRVVLDRKLMIAAQDGSSEALVSKITQLRMKLEERAKLVHP